MIKVTVGNNVERNSVIVDENVTLKSVLEQVEFDYSRTSMNLDGTTLKAGDLNKDDHLDIFDLGLLKRALFESRK